MKQTDWMPCEEISRETDYTRKALYNQHYTRRGSLAGILTKVGGRLGCWRADYEIWRDQQRKLRDAA